MPDNLVDVPVTITTEHRDLGEPCHAACCPLAFALDDVMVPTAKALILSRSFNVVLRDDSDTILHYATLPPMADLFVKDFDSWNPQIVVPLTIPFRLPRDLVRKTSTTRDQSEQ